MEKSVQDMQAPRKQLKVNTISHIDRKRGILKTGALSPIVVMKKIKLRRTDGEELASLKNELPELEDEDEPLDTEIQLVQDQKANQRVSKSIQEDLSFAHTMTLEELNDHVQKCLEMSTENKINQKNAFALQLIDCMSTLMRSKKDFSTMACTLDAGAKIYSYRVDALHQLVMKLAEEVFQSNRKNAAGHDEISVDSLGKKNGINEKRKANKKAVIASKESISRKLKGSDPKDNYIRVEALPGAIISGARRDPKDLSLSLNLSVPFWKSWDKYNPLRAEGTVNLPEIKIIRDSVYENQKSSPGLAPSHTMVPKTYDDNDNIVIDPDETDSSSQGYASIANFLTGDPQSEQEPVNDDLDLQENNEPDCTEDVDEVDIISTAMNRLRTEAETNGAVNKVPSRLEAMKMLFEDVGEYDYLNLKNKNYWAGPEFWKRPRNRVENGEEKKHIKRKRREPGDIDYDYDNVDERWNNIINNKNSLGRRTMMNWKKTKNTLPKDLKTDFAMFIDLFHMNTCRGTEDKLKNIDSVEVVNALESLNVNEISSDSLKHQDSQEINSSDSQDVLNDSFYEDAPGNRNSGSSEDRDPLNSTFYDVGMFRSRQIQPPISNLTSGKVIKVEITSERNKMFGESSMVPVPKMVQYQPLKYSTRPIRVDMHHLKESMMGIIEEGIDQDEQDKKTKRFTESVSNSSSSNRGTLPPETRFSDILRNLPSRLKSTTAKDTSPAIAFMALLTLANENNLQLENTENYKDVIVKLEERGVERDENDDEENFMETDY